MGSSGTRQLLAAPKSVGLKNGGRNGVENIEVEIAVGEGARGPCTVKVLVDGWVGMDVEVDVEETPF